jgi:hypothetical protein
LRVKATLICVCYWYLYYMYIYMYIFVKWFSYLASNQYLHLKKKWLYTHKCIDISWVRSCYGMERWVLNYRLDLKQNLPQTIFPHLWNEHSDINLTCAVKSYNKSIRILGLMCMPEYLWSKWKLHASKP